MKRVIIVGSPRSNGRSAHLAEMLFEANIDERPEDELYLVPVSEVEIGPCIGCSACRKPTKVMFKSDSGEEAAELRQRCVFDDDMQTLYDLLDEADELTVVSPIYFSGAPAPMKCVFDRMQPYFWVTQVKGREQAAEGEKDVQSELDPAYVKHLRTKRPATLHVIGEGGDPHGFDPLVSEAKSALACAGFRLERVFDWVGKISADGEIITEAEEIELVNSVAQGWLPSEDQPVDEGQSVKLDSAVERGRSAKRGQPANQGQSDNRSQAAKQCQSKSRTAQKSESGSKRESSPRSSSRPKLDLSAGQKKRRSGTSAKRAHGHQGSQGGKGKRRG